MTQAQAERQCGGDAGGGGRSPGCCWICLPGQRCTGQSAESGDSGLRLHCLLSLRRHVPGDEDLPLSLPSLSACCERPFLSRAMGTTVVCGQCRSARPSPRPRPAGPRVRPPPPRRQAPSVQTPPHPTTDVPRCTSSPDTPQARPALRRECGEGRRVGVHAHVSGGPMPPTSVTASKTGTLRRAPADRWPQDARADHATWRVRSALWVPPEPVRLLPTHPAAAGPSLPPAIPNPGARELQPRAPELHPRTALCLLSSVRPARPAETAKTKAVLKHVNSTFKVLFHLFVCF